MTRANSSFSDPTSRSQCRASFCAHVVCSTKKLNPLLCQPFPFWFLYDYAAARALLDKIGAANAKCIQHLILEPNLLVYSQKYGSDFLKLITDDKDRMKIKVVETQFVARKPKGIDYIHICLNKIFTFCCKLRLARLDLRKVFLSGPDPTRAFLCGPYFAWFTFDLRLVSDEVRMKPNESVLDLDAAMAQFGMFDGDL